jgi:ABC-type antimicrobial peptide transport system permease subunit
VAAPLLLAMGLAARHYFPIGALLTTSVGVLVSVSIVALVLAATWVPTRKVLRVALSDALRSE